jgi:hypothetical protein
MQLQMLSQSKPHRTERTFARFQARVGLHSIIQVMYMALRCHDDDTHDNTTLIWSRFKTRSLVFFAGQASLTLAIKSVSMGISKVFYSYLML